MSEGNNVLLWSNRRSYYGFRQIQSRTVFDNGVRQVFVSKGYFGWWPFGDFIETFVRQNINSEKDIKYCSGAIGVPITVLDKYNPDQFQIINANNIRLFNEVPEKLHGLIKDKEATISMLPQRERERERERDCYQNYVCSNCYQTSRRQVVMDGMSTENESMQESLLLKNNIRYCSGILGVPITFIDNYNPGQFSIIALGNSRENFTPIKDYINPKKHLKDGKITSGGAINCVLAVEVSECPSNTVYYTSDNSNFLVPPYARILIQRRSENDEDNT